MRDLLKSTILIASFSLLSFTTRAQVSLGISISANIAPPALPVYAQPEMPNDGFIWTPGYWAYTDPDGYFWVPGVWVRPPHPGVLWTPAYWGYAGGMYGFHSGYWGPHVGFYGGINYGYGYGGVGFGGGVWAGNSFRYNTAVSNVNTTIIHNTYINNTVINNNTTVNNNTSFNGQGGTNSRPNEQERSAGGEEHIQPTPNQLNHQHNASQDHSQFASVNRGKPATTAMNRVNGKSFNGNTEVDRRSENQQQKIAGGNRDGQLNQNQAAQQQNRQQKINQQIHAERQANGMNSNQQHQNQQQHLNQQQHREINQQQREINQQQRDNNHPQNRVGRQIDEKHKN